MPLLAGAARLDITPPPGQPMAGFPMLKQTVSGAPADVARYFGREGMAQGVHDPLYARALVLDDGQQAVALVAVDLIVVTSEFTAQVRQAIQTRIDISPDHILLAASHTHAGPDLFRWEEGLEPTVTPAIRDTIVEAVVQAYANRRPARIGWGDGHLDSISINRRDPAGPIDPRVGVMWVEDEQEQPIALAISFAVHTCLLSAVNLLYSAELSGAAMVTLERVYPGAVALFLQGAAGNINPVAYLWGPKANIVPIFREAWHAGRPHPRTFRNMLRLGRTLAATAIQAAESISEYHSELSVHGAVRPVSLPLKPPHELAQFREFMNLGPNFGATRLDTAIFETEVQAIAIGPTRYVGLPGEPLVELGLDLLRRLGPAHAYVVGYANDDARYVLPAAAYADNRYDTWGSMLAAGSGELLVDAAYAVAQAVE